MASIFPGRALVGGSIQSIGRVVVQTQGERGRASTRLASNRTSLRVSRVLVYEFEP